MLLQDPIPFSIMFFVPAHTWEKRRMDIEFEEVMILKSFNVSKVAKYGLNSTCVIYKFPMQHEIVLCFIRSHEIENV